jgi:hypothetical protein
MAAMRLKGLVKAYWWGYKGLDNVIINLRAAGYKNDFQVSSQGELVCKQTGDIMPAGDLKIKVMIERVYYHRPGAAVLALENSSGTAGLLVGYGQDLDTLLRSAGMMCK